MGFDIFDYCARLQKELLARFGGRLCYMGLQGSWLRGEATEQSDIDVVVLLDTLTVADLDAYRAILEGLGDFDRSCGFISGTDDLARWNPLEICHLLHATRDLYGRLADFVPAWTREDEIHFIKLSLNNLYHALCHSYVHGSREALADSLPGLYKSVFFILQNTHFAETGDFLPTKAQLLTRLQGQDKAVLQTVLELTAGRPVELRPDYDLLFQWCRDKLAALR